MCLCARSACTPPLLAGVCGVGVCSLARVSAAPRHSWLGCWGVCVLVCVLRLYPATPGRVVQCGCVCLGSGFGCAPLLLAGVLGSVCVCLWASLVPRHSWLGCAVWVSVLGLGFRLRPATPGPDVGVCLCLCTRSACTPPLLAGVCGVGVCAWARVSAAPRHSWPGCWAACVFVCALRLEFAIPGLGVRCGCVCFGSGFGCAPPLLARVMWCVRVCVRAPLVPRHSWRGCAVWVCMLRLGFGCAPPLRAGVLGCVCPCVRSPLVPRHSWLGCAAWVCVLGLGFRLRPATPCLGVGVCVCLCARSACTPPLLAGSYGVGVCAWALVLAAPRLFWLGYWGLLAFVSGLRLYPATPGWGARSGCLCLGSGFGCAPPLLAGLLGCVCVCVRALLGPRHSWLGCTVWVYVLGLGFRLRSATPCLGVGVCVCLYAHSACTPPLLDGVCSVAVCAWARVSAARRHFWLGCWGVSVFVYALCLGPGIPGWGVRCGYVCSGLGFGCAPPLLFWVLGCVCVCMRTPLVPRHSWMGCAVWQCVLGLGFRLHAATPGLGVRLCVCLCARSACTPPFLAGVCGVGVCAWVRASAAPSHSPLGCSGVCVFVCRLRLYSATPGWGVRYVCVWLGSGFGCAPPVPAGVPGFVCVCVRAPLVARHSWLGCAVWVCVLWLGFRLQPATPGCGAGVCVSVCSLYLYPAFPGLRLWSVPTCSFGSGTSHSGFTRFNPVELGRGAVEPLNRG